MTSQLDPYNIATIRDLLRDAFADKELRRFCQDRPAFRPVLTNFSSSASLEDMIDVLIDHCRTQVLLPELLIEIQRANPRQYERYQRQLYGAEATPSPHIPDNLPPRSEFIGREEQKTWLHEALQSRPNLVCIDGMGGIGKSALALEIAHECLHASRGERPAGGTATFAGFIWVTAKERDVALNDVLDTIARTLGYPGVAQKPAAEKRIDVCNLLRDKPYLLVVDNLETITDEQVRDFLTELPEPSRALITTRAIKPLGGAWMLTLEDLDQAETLALMRSEGRRLRLQAIERASDEVLLRLYQSTSGAPLAIKWAVGQIKQRGQSLNTVLAALRRAKADIFQTIFAASWEMLSDDARQVLIIMPLFATSASWAGIEAVSGVQGDRLDEALGQLVEMSLLDVSDELELTPRYSIHLLTHAHALALAHESSLLRQHVQDAFERMITYYRQLVTPLEEVQIGDPYWNGLFNDAGAQDLEQEWENVARLIRWALSPDPAAAPPKMQRLFHLVHWPADPPPDRVALDLFLPTVHFLNGWGLWDDRLELGYKLCTIAYRLDDPAEAWLWIDGLGYILNEQKQRQQIGKALAQGREAARRHNLTDALLLADSFEAWLYLPRDRRDIAAVRQKVEPALEGVNWDNIQQYTPVHRIILNRSAAPKAYTYWLEGDLEKARVWYERALALRRSTGENATPSLLRLARLCLQMGDVSSAEEYLNEGAQMPRPGDLARLNYTRALLAEHHGQVQEAIRLTELAEEQHRRFRQDRGMTRYRELLQRLRQESDRSQT